MLRSRFKHLIIILIFVMSITECCMPGYEAEREKLRQYLGIEWIPNGLKKMDEQKIKLIRYPEELNCDFQDVSKCRWVNNKKLDTLNFHLFEKQDHTIFPILQIRPGPSKLEPGDKLIFVGDRKKKDQSAILISWPIRCQNTTGKLFFDFWVYNGAMVEVLILEENIETGELKQSAEKIYVDCGSVAMNTECNANIPPKSTPFRIAIKAFDIRHPEGSFVMVDNIRYRASFCKVPIDFGPNFKTVNLMTKAEGMPINNSVDLKCSGFDLNCRWRNGGHLKKIWKKALTAPSETMMFNNAGTYTVPKAPFAFMYVEEYSKMEDLMTLVSDPIECQSSSGSTISFRLWATKGIKMSICTVDYNHNPIECQNVAMGRSPAPSVHHFEQISNFMYAFKISYINSDFDNFVIIDDIIYEATMCHEAIDALDFGKNFYSTPLLSVLLNRPVQAAEQLKCQFDKRGLDCLWANLENEKADWEVGLGTIDKKKFSSLTRRLTIPNTEFAVARLNRRNLSAVMISETIKCMNDRINLSFKFWHTGAAVLSVCIIKSISLEAIDCQKINASTTEHVYVDIPKFNKPFRIALKADSSLGEGIIIVDDIFVEGRLCSPILLSSNSKYERQTIPQSFAKYRQSVFDANVCHLLSCDFDRGHLCIYKSKPVTKNLSLFSVKNGTATTMLFGRSKIAMLESPPFHLNSAARLHFNYIIEQGYAEVFICEDSVNRELDSCYKVTNENKVIFGSVIHDYIEILPSDTKIYIIVKLHHNSKKSYIKIDNIMLTDNDDYPIC